MRICLSINLKYCLILKKAPHNNFIDKICQNSFNFPEESEALPPVDLVPIKGFIDSLKDDQKT